MNPGTASPDHLEQTTTAAEGLGWPGTPAPTSSGLGWAGLQDAVRRRPLPVEDRPGVDRSGPTPPTSRTPDPVECDHAEPARPAASVAPAEPLPAMDVPVTADPTPTPGRVPGPPAPRAPVSQLTHSAADRAAQELAETIPLAGDDTPLAQSLATDTRRRITLTGRAFPRPLRTRVMTVANQKGGVGKTTTTVNIAAALAQSGLSVLVLDLDPQGNASTALGIDHHADVPSVYDVLVDDTPLADVVVPCTTVPGLLCAPATIDLAGAEIELVSLVAREQRLARALATYLETTHVDYVLIDCPPSLGLLTINAFVAGSEVFIPIQCEYYALEGLSQLLKNVELVRKHLNPTLRVTTILLTMYDGRTRLSSQVAEEVRTHFPAEVLPTTVPRSVRVSEAPSFGETVMTYDPVSSGALAYLEAAGSIAARGAAPAVPVPTTDPAGATP